MTGAAWIPRPLLIVSSPSFPLARMAAGFFVRKEGIEPLAVFLEHDFRYL